MKVYISYAQADEDLAKRVAAGLEAAGLEAWLAGSEILLSDNWGEKIAQALKESQAMVVLLTPAALSSDSVQWDISYALSNISYKHRLIPVLVESGKETFKENIPWILERLNLISLPEQGEAEGIRQIAQALEQAA